MSEQDGDNDRGALATRIALTAVAVALAVTHIAWPHIRIDSITFALLIVAAVPWLHRVFKSVSTPFLGLEFRELKQRLDAVDSKAESSRQLAVANEARDLARRDQSSPDVDATLAKLAAEYTKLRSDMSPGAARTDLMTGVVGRMLAAIEAGAKVEVEHNLRSTHVGERLVGYAAVYARPDPAMASPIVDSITQVEHTPFGGYWGLQSLRRIVETTGNGVIDEHTRRQLRRYAETLPRGTDRAYEIGLILRLLD